MFIKIFILFVFYFVEDNEKKKVSDIYIYIFFIYRETERNLREAEIKKEWNAKRIFVVLDNKKEQIFYRYLECLIS